MSYEQFGREIGDFLRGLLGAGYGNAERDEVTAAHYPSSDTEYQTSATYRGTGAYQETSVVYNNPGAKLKPGHLLLTYQTTKSVYQVDPETGEIEFLFTLAREGGIHIWRAFADHFGNIYCSYSGAIKGEEPFAFAKLGNTGGVIRLNHQNLAKEMPWLPKVEYLARGVDPIVMRVLDKSRILVTDMGGFGGTGLIFIADITNGSKELIFSGPPLVDPVSSVIDADGICWIANGDQVKQDGDLLRLEPGGKLSVAMPRQGDLSGCMVDVLQSNKANELIIIKDNLPRLDNSTIQAFNKETNVAETLLSAKPGSSRFFSLGDVDHTTLWIAESVTKTIIKYDLESRKIVKEIDISALGGRVLGITASFEVFESISVIPYDLVDI